MTISIGKTTQGTYLNYNEMKAYYLAAQGCIELQMGADSHNDLCRIYCTHGKWLLLVLNCFLQPSPAVAHFSSLQSFLASVGVILALWCESFTSEMTRMYHENAT